jgi:hypothetical protein
MCATSHSLGRGRLNPGRSTLVKRGIVISEKEKTSNNIHRPVGDLSRNEVLRPESGQENGMEKMSGRGGEDPPRPVKVALENELAAKLQSTRIPGIGDLAEVAIRVLDVNAVELRVVEGVERLEAQFEVRPLRHCE